MDVPPILIGIDCGAKGAIAFMSPDGELFAINDMPVYKELDGKFMRSRVSEIVLLDLLQNAKGGHAFIEIPDVRPIFGRNRATGQRENTQPSAKNSFSFGMMYATARTACIASGMTVTALSPGAWKRAMSLPGDKDECRRLAAIKFAPFADSFKRVRDDGRAEAAYLALYGYRQLLKNSS
jgi:crossover junction endodeoxyribonuclease RuvC